jgi:molecular chaperone GrpE
MSDDPEKTSEDLLTPAAPEGSVAAGEDFSPPEPPEDDAAGMIRRLQAEKKELTELLLRKQAEVENIRKRLAREKEEFQQYSLFQAVEGFIPVLDAFELALQSDGGGDEYRKGVELIYQQLRNALQRLGLEPIESVGGQFNPYMHEAVSMVETDEYEDHHVLQELQRGYLFKNRLLRPARVKVAQRPPAETDSPPPSHDTTE